MTLTLVLIAGLLAGYNLKLKKGRFLIMGAILSLLALVQAAFYIAVNETASLSLWTLLLVLVASSAMWLGTCIHTRSSGA